METIENSNHFFAIIFQFRFSVSMNKIYILLILETELIKILHNQKFLEF